MKGDLFNRVLSVLIPDCVLTLMPFGIRSNPCWSVCAGALLQELWAEIASRKSKHQITFHYNICQMILKKVTCNSSASVSVVLRLFLACTPTEDKVSKKFKTNFSEIKVITTAWAIFIHAIFLSLALQTPFATASQSHNCWAFQNSLTPEWSVCRFTAIKTNMSADLMVDG